MTDKTGVGGKARLGAPGVYCAMRPDTANVPLIVELIGRGTTKLPVPAVCCWLMMLVRLPAEKGLSSTMKSASYPMSIPERLNVPSPMFEKEKLMLERRTLNPSAV